MARGPSTTVSTGTGPSITGPYSRSAIPPAPTTFRFGDGYLHLASDDHEFRTRFHDRYLDCITDEPLDPSSPVVRCMVHARNERGRVLVEFDDPEPLDQYPFAVTALDTLDYRDATPAGPGGRALRSDSGGSRLDFRHGCIEADADSAWQTVVGPLAVHRVLRLQRGSLFLHAAAVGIRGAGVLLSGPKGAGKTTLSLALADAGHQFLGDEISAVRTASLELIPFWRRLSIRQGPASASVTQALKRGGLMVTDLPDGTRRWHLHLGTLHPDTPRTPVPLRAIVILRTQDAAPRLERFTPRVTDMASLVPFESATWAADPRSVAMQVLSLMGRVPCYTLDLGPIPETVRLLETLSSE